MKKTALEVYALAVCFGAVTALAIYAAIGVWHVIGMGCPELTVDRYEYEAHQTDEAFANRRRRFEKDPAPMSPEEIRARRLESYAGVLRAERHDHLQGLVEGIIGITIAACVFIIHWLLARRVRNAGAVA